MPKTNNVVDKLAVGSIDMPDQGSNTNSPALSQKANRILTWIQKKNANGDSY